MILIVGGSGYLGRETARLLLERGQKVRLLVRTPSKVEDLRRLGAEVVEGDLIAPTSLVSACRGAAQVFAAAHSLLGKGRYSSEAVDDAGHRALIDAARGAGVAHFVYTSAAGAAPDHPVDFWRTKHRVEEHLKASGLGHTILRPTAFMEQHAHLFNGKAILESGKTTILGAGTKPRNFVASGDVARLAALALTDPRLKNRTLEVGGPDNLTNNQVTELYGRLAGITPRVGHLPPAVAGVMSALLKPFNPGISRIMYLSSLPDDAFEERFDPAPLVAEFGLRLTPLEEFVRARVAERRQVAAV